MMVDQGAVGVHLMRQFMDAHEEKRSQIMEMGQQNFSVSG